MAGTQVFSDSFRDTKVKIAPRMENEGPEAPREGLGGQNFSINKRQGKDMEGGVSIPRRPHGFCSATIPSLL